MKCRKKPTSKLFFLFLSPFLCPRTTSSLFSFNVFSSFVYTFFIFASFLTTTLFRPRTPPLLSSNLNGCDNRRGMNQAASAATNAASQAFGAMGQQVQKAAAQAAAQAAVNEVQNQFSNMMRTGIKK